MNDLSLLQALAQNLTAFHWLRPLWLVAIAPALLLCWLLWRYQHKARQWSHLISPQLLEHLLDPQTAGRRRNYLWGLMAAWVLACLALAGPSWEKRPLPVHKNEEALVLALDLSPSMLAEDLKPSRLVRARMKITDILKRRADGFTALVAYADDAHVVSPLTDDTETIRSLLRALHPNIMPSPGSRPEAAVAMAERLLKDAGINHGRILLITDGVVEQAVERILQQLDGKDIRLSVLGIGSRDGAPVPNDRGGFERDRSGDIIVAKLREDRLERLAGRTGGRYQRMTSDSSDIDWLLSRPSLGEERHRQLEREFDTWLDRGPWLVLLLLPLVLYSFRPGLLLALVFVPLLGGLSPRALAQDWQTPFLNQEQRAKRLLEADQPEAAAQLFETPEWRGSALYRQGEYEAAAQAFAQNDSARAHYNRGNALAKAGDLDGAIEAYDQALERQPDFPDARANRELVEKLKEQQEQEQQNQNQDQDQNSEDQQDQNQDQNQDQSQDQNQNQNQSSQQGEQDDSQDSDNQSQNPGEQEQPDSQEPSEPEDQEAEPESDQDQKQDQDQDQDQDQEQKQGQPENSESEPDEPQQAAPQTLEESDLSDEEQQAMEQWLKTVPDDPGGLLRRKFRYQSEQRRLNRYQNEHQEAPDTEERW